MKYWLTILYLMCCIAVFSNTIEVNKTRNITNLEDYENVCYSSDQLYISDLVACEWPHPNSSHSFKIDEPIKWVKYDFHNTQNEELKKFIYLPYHYIYKIDVYQKIATGYHIITKTGTSRNPNVKDLDARGYPIKITIPKGHSSIIIRYDNGNLPLRASAFFMSNKQMKQVLSNTMNKIWFWRGVFTVALLFSLMLYFASKNKLFLYYFLFNIGVALSLGSEVGDFMNLLGADVNSRVLDIKELGNIFILLFFPLFINAYTPVKNIHPKLWKIMYGGSFLAIFLMVYTFIPGAKQTELFLYIFYYFFLYTAAVLYYHVYLLLVAVRRKQKHALELFLLYAAYIFFVTLGVVLPTFEITGDNLYTYNYILFTSIGEILFFLFLIGANVIKVYISNNELLEKQKLHQQEIINAIVDSQEIERNKIGSEMHDLIGASIAMVRNNVDPDNKPIINLIDDTITTIKSLSNGLMTPRVKDGDFEEEIKHLCNLSSGEKMKVQYYFHDWPQLRKNDLSTHLYRIVQELLHNAMQHSNASKVHVQFLKRENDLCVLYEDNGKGLEYNESRKMGRGLMGIENRVQLIHGLLHVDSGANNGLSVMIEIKNRYN